MLSLHSKGRRPCPPGCDYDEEEDEDKQQVSLALPPLCPSVALCATATPAPIRTWTLTLYSMHLNPPLSRGMDDEEESEGL